MRLLLFGLLLVALIAGPYRYFTAGAGARAERRAHLARLQEQAAEVRTLLAEDVPPARHLLDTRSRRLDELEQSVDEFLDGVVPATPIQDEEGLRALGHEAGLPATVLEPLLAGSDAGAAGSSRRRAVTALLHALADVPLLQVERIQVAPRPVADRSLPLTRHPVAVVATVAPTAAVRFVERMLQGTAADPPADLVDLRLSRPAELPSDKQGLAAPPVRLELSVELLTEGGFTP